MNHLKVEDMDLASFNDTKEMALACQTYIDLSRISVELGQAIYKDANKPNGKNEFMKILFNMILKAKNL